MNLKETYNKIAEDWVKDHNKDTWWQEDVDYFLSLLSQNAKILDVGCGGGIKSRYISEKGYKVYGIDFSETMIEIAKRNNPEQEFSVVDMRHIDSLKENFDGIFAQASLLHIPKSEVVDVLEKMKEKLKTNGLLYVVVKGVRDDDIEEAEKTENDYGYEYKRFFSYFTLDELKNYFIKIGLDIIWEGKKDSNETNWVQIIGKLK